MKKTTLIILMTATLALTARAETTTNKVLTIDLKAPADAQKGCPTEITLGGTGFTLAHTGKTETALNASLAVQPFSKPIWLGVSQTVGWQPFLLGSTDLTALWAQRLYKEKLYLNAGWNVGTVYDSQSLGWRSGPEASLEYYLHDGACFVIGQFDYDVLHTGDVTAGFRYNLGVGFTLDSLFGLF